jgi:hypothetical protein
MHSSSPSIPRTAVRPGTRAIGGTARATRLTALLLTMAGPALAAPVDSEDTGAQAADPYELAMRWTAQVLSPQAEAVLVPVADVRVQAPPRYTGLPSTLPSTAQSSGVPDPRAYALMGALLLGVGLLARRVSAGQRGFSKKT